MDSSWASAAVAAIAVGSTLTIALVNRHDSRSRERLQFQREDAKDEAERSRAQRAVERDSVLKLSDIFTEARRVAERPEEEDPEGMDWDDAFPESWEGSYNAAMRESELVTDKEFREVFQDCTTSIISSWSLSRAGGGPSRRIARDTAALGFVVAGYWLRNEPIGPDARVRIDTLRKLTEAADEIWESQNAKSTGEES
jgi:hypothetical protein